MTKLDYDTYIREVVAEVLGSHYRYFSHVTSRWGFIYCEHFYGRSFKDVDNRKRHGYPGAVARIQDETVVVLDQSNDPNRERPPRDCDSEIISPAQPNFVERLATIKDIHDKVCKAYHLRLMRTRGNSHMVARPPRA